MSLSLSRGNISISISGSQDPRLFVGISGEKIEIDPVLKAKFSFKQKPVTYDTESIASCTLIEEKSSGICKSRLLQEYDVYKYAVFHSSLLISFMDLKISISKSSIQTRSKQF